MKLILYVLYTLTLNPIVIHAFGTNKGLLGQIIDAGMKSYRSFGDDNVVQVSQTSQEESRRLFLLSCIGGFATNAIVAPSVNAMVSSPQSENVKLGLKKDTCLSDCMKECAVIAPKDTAYCTEQCRSFCDQLEDTEEKK